MRSARSRPCAIGTTSPVRCSTMAGAETAPSADRTSMRSSASMRPRAIEGDTAARSKVPNARLERRDVRDRIGDARAGLVEDHEPREGGQALEEAGDAAIRPLEVEVRHPAPAPDEGDRPVPHDLVPDAHTIVALRVARFRR